jgi:hypothetical protein
MSTIEINSSDGTTVQITDQGSNTINLTQPISSIVEVVALGPQGPVGPQGLQGIPGSITSHIDLIVTGSIWASGSNGHITSSGNISSSGYIIASSFTGSLNGTSSFSISSSLATNALTASFLPVGTYNITSSWATNSNTASWATNINTASWAINALTASYSLSSSYSLTSSISDQTTSASYALTASYVLDNENLGRVIGYQLAPSTQTITLSGSTTGSFTNLSASFISPSNGKILVELANISLSSENNMGSPIRYYKIGLSSTSGSFTTIKNYKDFFSLPQNTSNTDSGIFEVSSKWIIENLTPGQSYTYYFFFDQSGASTNPTQLYISSILDQTAVIMTSLP